MANDSGSGGGGGLVIALIAAFAAGPLIILILLAMGFAQDGPSPKGSSKPQTIDPAPTSKDQPALATFDRSVDPKNWLAKNGSNLSDISTQFQNQDKAMSDGVAFEGAPGDRVTKMKAQLKIMIADITAIQQAKAASPDQIKKTAKLITDWGVYDNLRIIATAATLADQAIALVTQNKNGTGDIAYIASRPVIVINNTDPKGLDTSGFIVYSLIKTRIFHGNDQPSVDMFYTRYSTDTRFTLVDSALNSRIDDSKAQGELQKGDIVLTSTGDVSSADNAQNVNQAFMYIGAGHSEGDVVESTVSGSKTGPQFDTLNNHLSSGTVGAKQKIQVILRLATPSPSTTTPTL